MTEWKKLESPELKELFKKHLLKGALVLFGFAVAVLVLAFYFEEPINNFAQGLVEKFGVYGLVAMVFFTDTLVSPIPPDATLFFIGRSALHAQWYTLVPLLGAVSTVAGVVGWWIGRRLKNIRYFRRIVDYVGGEYKGAAKKFGFWVVVIGALTPVPFSLTCWFAGMFKMPLKTFVVAASFRIPRFVIYYWAMFYSGEIGAVLRQWMNF